MTDLHMLASPQLLVADMRGHMDTCWPLDAPQLAEGTVHAQFHTIFTFYIGYMYSTSCSNFQLCSDQGITCHQSLAESSHLSKHEAGRIWKVKVSFQP